MQQQKYCFGIDVGGTTVKMGLFQVDGTLLNKWEIPTNTENQGESILSDIVASIQDKMKEKSIKKTDVVGVGAGVPAPVSKEGSVERTANLGWGKKEVKKELEELLGLPVNVGNDANVAALGEMWQGGGRGHQDLVMVTLGTGVGGGVIINGHILTGANGGAGEIGHICVNYEETDCCGCGKTGCLEQYASATGIAKLAKKYGMKDATAKDVFDAVKAGDEVAIQIAEEFGNYLGHALANIATVLDPEVFVIGGGVSKAGEILLDFVQKPYVEKAFWIHKNAKFALATLGNDAGIYGAAKLALE